VAKYFIGYDERHQAWVRFGAMSTGQYFAIRMTDDGKGGWGWKYVSFFPRTTPETSGSDATFTRKSDTQYTVRSEEHTSELQSPSLHDALPISSPNISSATTNATKPGCASVPCRPANTLRFG